MLKQILGLGLGFVGGLVAARAVARRAMDAFERGGLHFPESARRRVGAFGPPPGPGAAVGRIPEARDAGERLEASSGLLRDERITDMIRSDWERLGFRSPLVDVTTVDGTVYLRGRAKDAARLDAMIASARSLSGVQTIIDEVQRPATTT